MTAQALETRRTINYNMVECLEENSLTAYHSLDWLRSEAVAQRKSSFVNLLDQGGLPDVPSLESIPLTLEECPEPVASTGTSESELHLEELEPYTFTPKFLLIPVVGLNRVGKLSLEERKDKISRFLGKRKQRKTLRHSCCFIRKAIAKSRLRYKGKFISQAQALELAKLHTPTN